MCRSLLTTCCVLFIWQAEAFSQESSPRDISSLETPLPPGAMVRFGTTRFRTGTAAGNLKLSPDGKKLISGGGVFVWDAVTGKRILWRPLGEEGELSRDGELLFLIETLQEVGRFHCGVKGVHTMCFSPDSQVLAVCAKDATVLLVDVRKVLSIR